MTLNQVAPNQTEVTINGNTVFFSYKTPVAAMVDGQLYRTDKKWSVTTSKHINQWLDGRTAQVKPQSFFDNLTT